MKAKRKNKKAYLIRWVIYKQNLDISITLPLTEARLFEDIEYTTDINQIPHIGEAGNSMVPFQLIIAQKINGLDLDELITTYTTTIIPSPSQNITITTSDPALYDNYLAYTLNIEASTEYKNKETNESVINVETTNFIMSAAKPYLSIDVKEGPGPLTYFKRVEQKEFGLDDYSGYSIAEWTPPPPSPDEPE